MMSILHIGGKQTFSEFCRQHSIVQGRQTVASADGISNSRDYSLVLSDFSLLLTVGDGLKLLSHACVTDS